MGLEVPEAEEVDAMTRRVRSFTVRYAAGVDERFHLDAGDRLRGRRTTVIRDGARLVAEVVTARVVEDGAALEVTLRSADEIRKSGPDTDPCIRKIRFADEDAVKAELANIIERSMSGERVRHRHLETGYYRCTRCRFWHLSSRPWGGSIRGTVPGKIGHGRVRGGLPPGHESRGSTPQPPQPPSRSSAPGAPSPLEDEEDTC